MRRHLAAQRRQQWGGFVKCAAVRLARGATLMYLGIAAGAGLGIGVGMGDAAAATDLSALPETAMAAPAPGPQAQAQVLGQTQRLWVVRPAEGDTLAGLAHRFLGRADRAWVLAERNNLDGRAPAAALPTSKLLVVPRLESNPRGFSADGYQTVPILSYHRFGSEASPLVVSPEDFDAQLQTLAELGAQVLPLAAMAEFLAARAPLPAKSVVITVDDGHESFFRLAFPLLKKHKTPATLFVPTDTIGKGDALNWQQLQEMAASGLVSVQSHGKTHRNLTERAPGESTRSHQRALEVEVQTPRKLMEQSMLGVGDSSVDMTVRHLAYPYGQADAEVLNTLQRNAFELGLSMAPGGNAFYTHPYLLRRTLVMGGNSLDAFISNLQWRRALPP